MVVRSLFVFHRPFTDLFLSKKKISVLQHAPEAHLPIRPGDPTPTSRNLNPLMHPFAKARERIRALNAAKMDRMFAKPFVDSLGGHVDGVEVLVRQQGSLTTLASGSWDGGMCVHPVLSFPFCHLIFFYRIDCT